MPKIQWSESFSVGVSVLDEHHQHLAKLINQLSEETVASADQESLVDVISGLVAYAKYHFEHEEALMEKHGFPRFHKHCMEHNQFYEVIAETSYGTSLGIIDVEHLVDYLVRWWKNHILHEDMQYKPFFQARGVN